MANRLHNTLTVYASPSLAALIVKDLIGAEPWTYEPVTFAFHRNPDRLECSYDTPMRHEGPTMEEEIGLSARFPDARMTLSYREELGGTNARGTVTLLGGAIREIPF